MLQEDIFTRVDLDHLLPSIEQVSGSADVPTNIWDIPYTIAQLSYLTHNHYRYYGKFPSAVAAQIIRQHFVPTEHGAIYDHFAGSGTTLVEAKLRGFTSFGMDISWISVLVSNVKVRPVDLQKLQALMRLTVARAADIAASVEELSDAFTLKWFDADAAKKLIALQKAQLEVEASAEADFLLVAFLGIVRRVSTAFDGEVRPHVNKEKKPREVFSAFKKKVEDMVARHHEFQNLTDPETTSFCVQGNNALDSPDVPRGKAITLAVSHPPYLNSFNYRPVYSLEFYWGKPFEPRYATMQAEHDIKRELVAHPANDANTEKYFKHLKDSYKIIHQVLERKGKLAVVIGDCTRAGELVPVIEKTIDICGEIGFSLVERNYRTTHYGLGKYAYKHRADYHGEKVEKRDGIMVFQRN